MSGTKRLITAVVLIVAAIVIVITIAGILFLRSSPKAVGVSAATAVGIPNGPATKKIIGPPGGSITSSDGRITVTVPPNDLSGPVEFVVTPITNQAPGGFGNAYRLEPNGQKFATPVEISFKYTEQELEGTIPEALMATYQEEAGGWRMFTNERVDESGRFLTIPTTHFTDTSLGKKYVLPTGDKWDPSKYPIQASVVKHFRVSPEKATIHPGESVAIDFIGCENENGVMGWRKRLSWKMEAYKEDCFLNGVGHVWDTFYVAHGIGWVYPNYGQHVLYTAPSKKPTPNVVRIECGVSFNFGDRNKFPYFNDISGAWHYHTFIDGTEITIVDRGYRASGSDGPTSYSGTICSLEKPFVVTGKNGPVTYDIQFTPSSGLAGFASSSASYKAVEYGGSGPYTVEGIDKDKPRIVYHVTSILSLYGRTSGGTGDAHIDLLPLDTDECDKP